MSFIAFHLLLLFEFKHVNFFRLFYSKQSLRKFCFIFDVLFINGGCANNRGYQILTLYSNLVIFCLIMRKSFSVILLDNQVNCLFRCRQKGVSWENI